MMRPFLLKVPERSGSNGSALFRRATRRDGPCPLSRAMARRPVGAQHAAPAWSQCSARLQPGIAPRACPFTNPDAPITSPRAPLRPQARYPGAIHDLPRPAEPLALRPSILLSAQKPNFHLSRKCLIGRARKPRVLLPTTNCFWATIPEAALGASSIPDENAASGPDACMCRMSESAQTTASPLATTGLPIRDCFRVADHTSGVRRTRARMSTRRSSPRWLPLRLHQPQGRGRSKGRTCRPHARRAGSSRH